MQFLEMTFLEEALSFLNQHAFWLLAGGAVLVVLWNWRNWMNDRQIAMKILSQKKPLVTLQQTPKVSVLVAAWNEELSIGEHIKAFVQLSYPNKELILCAGGSDNTYEIASQYQDENVRLLEQKSGEGKQAALKRCLNLSSGEVIFLTDADCLLRDEPFQLNLASLVNDNEEAVTGGFSPYQHQRRNSFVLMQWYVDNYGRARSPKYIEGIIGRNAALTRSIIDNSGGMLDPVAIGTDYYLARKVTALGVKIRFLYESVVETEFKTTYGSYLRQQSRWLRNIIVHGKTFGAWGQVRSALGQMLIGPVILLWPLSFPITGSLGIILWMLLLLHGSCSRFRYIRFGELTLNQPAQYRLYIFAPIYLVADMLMLSYSLIELFVPWLRWKW